MQETKALTYEDFEIVQGILRRMQGMTKDMFDKTMNEKLISVEEIHMLKNYIIPAVEEYNEKIRLHKMPVPSNEFSEKKDSLLNIKGRE